MGSSVVRDWGELGGEERGGFCEVFRFVCRRDFSGKELGDEEREFGGEEWGSTVVKNGELGGEGRRRLAEKNEGVVAFVRFFGLFVGGDFSGKELGGEEREHGGEEWGSSVVKNRGVRW